jgi:hypothetical protein
MGTPAGTSIPTWTSGQVLNAADLDVVGANVLYLLAPEQVNPSVAALSVPNGTATTGWTAVTGLTGGINTGAYATVAGGIVTIGWGGTYDLTYLLRWFLSTAGRRKACLKKVSSGVTTWLLPSDTIPSLAGPTFFPDGTTASVDSQSAGSNVILLTGDTLELYVWQDSGAALVLTAAELDLVFLNN